MATFKELHVGVLFTFKFGTPFPDIIWEKTSGTSMQLLTTNINRTIQDDIEVEPLYNVPVKIDLREIDPFIGTLTMYKTEYGRYHREDGPAIVSDCQRQWFNNGERHNLNGPAIEWVDSVATWDDDEYFVNGVHCKNKQEYKTAVEKYKEQVEKCNEMLLTATL